MPTPTDEQVHAADAFRAGHHLALQASAGTGKTTTLALLATSTQRRGRYLAFNKSIAQDAAARFPRTVQCKTAHATVYAALGHRYTGRLNSPHQPAWRGAQVIPRPVALYQRPLLQGTMRVSFRSEVRTLANETETQWKQVQALASRNQALAVFQDPDIGPVIVFPKDYPGDSGDLQRPTDWTDSYGQTPASWPTPTTAQSPQFTVGDIAANEEEAGVFGRVELRRIAVGNAKALVVSVERKNGWVRREAPYDRVEAQDRCRRAVVAAG